MWYIGQEIICVDDSGSETLIKGKTYTITGIFPEGRCCNPGLLLAVGVKVRNYNPGDLICACADCGAIYPTPPNGENRYSESRFRPLISGYSEEEVESVDISELVNPELVEV